MRDAVCGMSGGGGAPPPPSEARSFFGWFGFNLLMVWSVCYDPVAAAVRHVWADDGDNDNARRGHGTETELWAVPVQKRIATTSGVGAASWAGLYTNIPALVGFAPKDATCWRALAAPATRPAEARSTVL